MRKEGPFGKVDKREMLRLRIWKSSRPCTSEEAMALPNTGFLSSMGKGQKGLGKGKWEGQTTLANAEGQGS